jgi:low affinity Fe/Cu permease
MRIRPSSSTVTGRGTGTRLIHVIGKGSALPTVAWALLTTDAVWVVYSVAAGFPARIESIFQTLVAAVTLAFVFVIQHTQTREQVVTQRKLDEILRALPHADNTMIGLEEATDAELAAVHTDHRELRAEAIRSTDDAGS